MIKTLGSRNSLSVSLAPGVKPGGLLGMVLQHASHRYRHPLHGDRLYFFSTGRRAGGNDPASTDPARELLMGPDLYNQVFTMHGSTMIFLFAVPMMFQGFGVYVVPLMCGARNIAFPRLNAFSYYLYVGGGLAPLGRPAY